VIIHALAAAIKPALAGGALIAAAAGGYYAIDNIRGDDATPFARIQSSGQRLLISEFGASEDAIVAVDPADTGNRETIATIGHAPEWGIFPSLSPDGTAIAYTALPSDAPDPQADTPAHAAIVDVDGDTTLLADDVDLLIAPVWSPDSQSIVVRKNVGAENAAGSFELILLSRDGTRTSLTSWSTAAVFPIAFAPDGSKLYFATLNATGSDLYSVAPDASGETLIAHLSDDIAREWTLSPDGSTVAYTSLDGATATPHAMTVDLATGAVTDAVPSDPAVGEMSPAFDSAGTLTIAELGAAGGGASNVDGAGTTATISDGATGFDLPLAWSPDNSSLAVRSVAPDSGASYIELVAPGGQRERVSDRADVLIVGWLE
jgi:Tol biopolymer transport system component